MHHPGTILCFCWQQRDSYKRPIKYIWGVMSQSFKLKSNFPSAPVKSNIAYIRGHHMQWCKSNTPTPSQIRKTTLIQQTLVVVFTPNHTSSKTMRRYSSVCHWMPRQLKASSKRGVVGVSAVLLTVRSFIDNSNNALMTMHWACIRQVKHISLSLIMKLMHCYNCELYFCHK